MTTKDFTPFLVDCERRAQEMPSFRIPHERERATCRPGDAVKIVLAVPAEQIAKGQRAGERPWLCVRTVGTVDGQPYYRCTFENAGAVFGFRPGDMITILPKHICDIERGWASRNE